MKRSVSGEIVCSKVNKSHSLRRYVEQEVARWARRLGAETRYCVRFETQDQGTGREAVRCELDVAASSMRWSSRVIGRRPKEAFSQCLNRLEPMTAV